MNEIDMKREGMRRYSIGLTMFMLAALFTPIWGAQVGKPLSPQGEKEMLDLVKGADQLRTTPTPTGRPTDLGFTWDSKQKDRLIVVAVRPSSAADDGKFLKNDVLLKVEGTAVSTPKAFDERVAAFTAGARLKILVERDAKPRDLWLVLPATAPRLIPISNTLPDLTGVLKLNQLLQGDDGLYRKDGALYTGPATYGGTTVIGLSTFEEGRYMHFVEWVNGTKHNETWKDKEGRLVRSARYKENGDLLSETPPRAP